MAAPITEATALLGAPNPAPEGKAPPQRVPQPAAPASPAAPRSLRERAASIDECGCFCFLFTIFRGIGFILMAIFGG